MPLARCSCAAGCPRRNSWAQQWESLKIMDRGIGTPWGGNDGMTTTTENNHAHPQSAADVVTDQPTVRVAAAASVMTITATEKRTESGPPRSQAPEKPVRPWIARNLHMVFIVALSLAQTGLLIISFLPARVVLNLGWTTSNGPFPSSTAPAVTAVFYLLPFVIGLLA